MALWGVYVFKGEYCWKNLNDSHMFFYSGSYRIYERDGYGIINYGPGLTLQNGKYTLQWEIESDGINTVSIKNSKPINCSIDGFEIEETQGKVSFTLFEESDNLEFLIDFKEGSFINVKEISLFGPRNSDRYWLITFVLLSCILIVTLDYRGTITVRTDGIYIFGIIVTALLASLPAFRNAVYLGHDGAVHIARLRSLASSIMTGQFPVRVGASMFNGYGDLFPVYYPHLFLLPAAFMMILHSSTQMAFQSTLVLISIVTAFFMFGCTNALLNNKKQALLATILYVFAPYRLTNVFIRVAFGEVLGMTFFPLILWGVYECICGNRKRWPILSVGLICLANSHVLSFLLAAVICCIAFFMCLLKFKSEKRSVSLLLAGTLAILGSLSVFTPIFTFLKQGINTSYLVKSTVDNALTLGNLLGIEAGDPIYWKEGSRSIGFLLLLAGGLVICDLIRGRYKSYPLIVRVLFGLGLLFTFSTTKYFPWSFISRVTAGKSDMIQFPFRLISLADLLFSVVGGYIYGTRFSQKKITDNNRGTWLRYGNLFCLLLCISLGMSIPILQPVWNTYPQYTRGDNTNDIYLPPDYFPEGANIYTTKMLEPQITGEMDIKHYKKTGTEISFDVSTETGGKIVFPLFAFDGYSASLNGERLKIAEDSERRISLYFPAKVKGSVNISYRGKVIWIITDCLSAVSIIVLYSLIRRKRQIINT